MKKLIIAFLTLFCISQSHAITRDQAYAIISAHVDETTMDVYSALLNTPKLPPEVTSTGYHWVFFVDEEPQKGWAHNCTYYYVPYMNSTSTYTAVHLTIPRSDIGMLWYKGVSCGTRQDIDLDYAELTESQQNASSRVYAIILSGGGSKFMNYARYWNDCSFIYQTLTRRYGVQKDHISVIMGDGTNPATDMRSGTSFISSPTDLDGDGEADIQYAATKANVVNELARMRENLTEQDKLLFFVTDHGGTEDNDSISYICLWNEEKIYDYEVAAQMAGTRCRYINIVMGQCYSGGFIDDLKGVNRVISTACSGCQFSYASSNLKYDEFLYHWTAAINEANHSGMFLVTDSTGDGTVSMYEAFSYAKNHDAVINETPQYSSLCEKIGKRSTLHSFSPKWDLMIRDSIGDSGIEPSLTYDSWSSLDILQRQNANDPPTMHESVEITEIGQLMYTWVRVTNVGCQTYPGSGWFLHLYWSNAIAGIDLLGWLGAHNENNLPHGGKCNQAQEITDTIAAGESVWVKVRWLLPNDISRYIINNGGAFHLCLLARVSDENMDDDGKQMGLPSDPYQVDVIGDRRIAQKNVAVYSDSQQASQGMELLVSNLYDRSHDYSLEVVPTPGDTTSLSNH